MSEALKPGWRRVRFGEVVRLNKESSRDPAADGLARYVGLEHIEPGDLRIRSWGNIADGTTFTNRFRPGQVLFGKRRAYQRKVAVADFDGVCSGDIYVFEPKDRSELLPELLPFICQTDAFFDYAVSTSAGSLSPRTNWKSLAEYEFTLPPLEEQRRMATTFTKVQEGKFSIEDAQAKFFSLYEGLSNDLLGHTATDTFQLREISSRITNGFVGSAAKHYADKGIPYLRSLNVRRSGLGVSDLVYITHEFHEKTRKSQLRSGDLLTVQSGHVGETCVVPPSSNGWNCHAVIITTLIAKRADPHFVAAYLNSAVGQREMSRFFVGSTIAHLNTSDLARMRIPLPSIAAQKKFIHQLNDIQKAENDLAARLNGVNQIARQLQTILS